MSDKLITVASFPTPGLAMAAKHALETAGIRVALDNENIIAMDWLMSNAVGGMKLLVMDDDAERALAILDEKYPAEQLEEALAEEPAEEQEPEAEVAAPPSPGVVWERDDYARQLVFTGFLGLACFPAAFYGVYLFLNAAFSPGPLSPRGRFHLIVGGFLTAASLLIAAAFLVSFSDLP